MGRREGGYPTTWTVGFDDVLRIGAIYLVDLVEIMDVGGDLVGWILQN
jgi:hypothetical protein